MTNERTQWTPSADTMDGYSAFRYLGDLEIEGDPDNGAFIVLADDSRLVFGGACNVGFLESGYMVREDWETLDEALAELSEELETFYRDGAGYASRIVHNDLM